LEHESDPDDSHKNDLTDSHENGGGCSDVSSHFEEMINYDTLKEKDIEEL
jgi:hypothetical protein